MQRYVKSVNHQPIFLVQALVLTALSACALSPNLEPAVPINSDPIAILMRANLNEIDKEYGSDAFAEKFGKFVQESVRGESICKASSTALVEFLDCIKQVDHLALKKYFPDDTDIVDDMHKRSRFVWLAAANKQITLQEASDRLKKEQEFAAEALARRAAERYVGVKMDYLNRIVESHQREAESRQRQEAIEAQRLNAFANFLNITRSATPPISAPSYPESRSIHCDTRYNETLGKAHTDCY